MNKKSRALLILLSILSVACGRGTNHRRLPASTGVSSVVNDGVRLPSELIRAESNAQWCLGQPTGQPVITTTRGPCVAGATWNGLYGADFPNHILTEVVCTNADWVDNLNAWIYTNTTKVTTYNLVRCGIAGNGTAPAEPSSAAELPAAPVVGPSPGDIHFLGWVDSAQCNGVKGWAVDLDLDRNNPNAPIWVSLWDGDHDISDVIAGEPRPDVGAYLSESALPGDNGLHGFTLPIPAAYADQQHHLLTVRVGRKSANPFQSNAQIPGQSVKLFCGDKHQYAGYIDQVTCGGIVGWAADQALLYNAISVSLWDEHGLKMATEVANASRPDVGAAIGDSGLHGFYLPIPRSYPYLDGRPHTFQVRFGDSMTGPPLGQPVNYSSRNCLL